jgi:hypothetical protein
LAKSERVVDRAAKLHELEMNPKNVARPTLDADVSPIPCFIRLRVTKTWIMLLIR